MLNDKAIWNRIQKLRELFLLNCESFFIVFMVFDLSLKILYHITILVNSKKRD